MIANNPKKKGKPSRRKPARSITLKPEVLSWAKQEAVKQDRSISYIISAFLEMAMHQQRLQSEAKNEAE